MTEVIKSPAADPAYWHAAEIEFSYQPDAIACQADVREEYMRRYPGDVDTALKVSDLQVNIVGLLEELGLQDRTKTFALLSERKCSSRFPATVGRLAPLPFYAQNNRGYHDIRRLTVRQNIAHVTNQAVAWDLLLDCTSNEAWGIPINKAFPAIVSLNGIMRTSFSRPCVDFDTSRNLLRVTVDERYEQEFSQVEHTGMAVQPYEVSDTLLPLFGGAQIDTCGRVEYQKYQA